MASALEFQVSSVQNINAKKANLIVLDFSTLDIFPYYMNDSKDMTIKISVELGSVSDTISKVISFNSGERVNVESLRKELPFKLSVDTDESSLVGQVTIQVEHASIGSDTYSQSFTVEPRELRDGVVRYEFESDLTNSWGDRRASDYAKDSGYSTDGIIGKSKEFNGVDEYLSIPDQDNKISNPSDYTIALWVKPHSFTGWQTAVGQWKINSNSNGWAHFGFEKDSNSVSNYINVDSTDRYVIDNSTGIVADEWVHLATTVETDGSEHNMKLYINGSETSSTTYSGDWKTDSNTNIGVSSKDPSSANNPVDGLIDDLRIYNRALTESKIQKIYNIQ